MSNHQYEQYKTSAGTRSVIEVKKGRKSRPDNGQLSARVRGTVDAGPRAERLDPVPRALAVNTIKLDCSRYLARQGQAVEVTTGTVLEVPEDASETEKANMRRWLENAEELSRRMRA